MKSRFYNDIYEILLTCRKKGLPVRIIARQVYNRHVGLFNQDLSFNPIYQYVRYYLWSQSQKSHSPFRKADKRGWYMLREEFFLQLELAFIEKQQQEKATQEKVYKEPSASLFD